MCLGRLNFLDLINLFTAKNFQTQKSFFKNSIHALCRLDQDTRFISTLPQLWLSLAQLIPILFNLFLSGRRNTSFWKRIFYGKEFFMEKVLNSICLIPCNLWNITVDNQVYFLLMLFSLRQGDLLCMSCLSACWYVLFFSKRGFESWTI